jgi:adenosylcobyric acid synthase
MTARAIMVLGTSSHVGKSLLTTALCRIFAQQGYRVAPFKSQNMSLNSAATIEGLEIGRAQALQAEAAGIAATVDMNPILLKPSGEMTSQVIVRGKIWGNLSATDYHRRRIGELLPIVRESYERLASDFDLIVLEGAGSPAEINLKQHDIVNMRMAEIANATCLLVGDIDRGGVFASLLGTVELLDPHERQRIGGFLINKFRGNLELLEPGIRTIEERLGKPCLGVVPYISSLSLEEEDSLGLPTLDGNEWTDSSGTERRLRIAVIAMPSFSNFTDFDALRSEPCVSVIFCKDVKTIMAADVIVLPGSKQTVDDLLWLRTKQLDQAILQYGRIGLVVGVCGGMQMLGETLIDPEGMEHAGAVRGLALLPISTIMQKQKITSVAAGEVNRGHLFGTPIEASPVEGYEIHIGQTIYLEGARPFALVTRRVGNQSSQHEDGCITADGRMFGTYLHGLFDNDNFRRSFISHARSFHRLSDAKHFENWKEKRQDSFDRLAAEVSQAVDLVTLFSWAGLDHHDRQLGNSLGKVREA